MANNKNSKRRPQPPPPRRGAAQQQKKGNNNRSGSGRVPRPTGMVGAAYATGRSAQMTESVFTKTERIGTITTGATVPGVVLTQYVNAGNLSAGPNSFLSRQAQLFDKYQFSKFEVEYVPVVSTATGGNLIIGMDLSPNDAAPTDAQGMTNLSLGYSEGNVWRGFKFPAQCFACFPAGPKYVRSGTAALGESASLYDMGALYAYAEGAPANTTLGYIDIHYKVHLQGVNRNTGEFSSALVRPTSKSTIRFNGTTITPGGLWASTTYASFNGQNQPAVNGLSLTGTPSVSTGWGNTPAFTFGAGTVTIPAGTYSLRLVATVASDTYANGAVSAAGGGVALTCQFGFGGLNYPTTSYVQSATSVSEEIVATFAAPVTMQLSSFLYYSTTVTASKTWNIVYADVAGRNMTYLEVTTLTGA